MLKCPAPSPGSHTTLTLSEMPVLVPGTQEPVNTGGCTWPSPQPKRAVCGLNLTQDNDPADAGLARSGPASPMLLNHQNTPAVLGQVPPQNRAPISLGNRGLSWALRLTCGI